MKKTTRRFTATVVCAALSTAALGMGTTGTNAENGQEVKLPVPVQTIDLDKDAVSGEGCRIDKELVFNNPFGTDEIQVAVQEYGLYETPEYTRKMGVQRAVWKKGLSVSYWIKVPAVDDGSYLPSGVLRWELDEELPQQDDYAKYLCSSNFDRLYQELSEEEKQASKSEESKVPYGSDYYFKYLETDGMDEDGAPKAKEYSDGELAGPVYDNRYFSASAVTQEGVSSPHLSAYYAFNPNYKRGFLKMPDGTYQRQAAEYADAYYNDYHTMDISAGSKVRRADVHGEFQIDVDNSVMWLPENGEGTEKNSNVDSFGKASYMQKENCFYMNSWYNEKRSGDSRITSYQAVDAVAALSPVTSVKNGITVKNGNCDKWHQVTVTLQNDKVGFYVDGEEVNVIEEYGVNGYACLDTAASVYFSSFNKGGGLRDSSWGTMMDTDNSYYLNKGRMVCQLFMEWITNKDAKLYIGGNGDYAGQHNLASESHPFYLDDVNFYGELLTREQIQALYQKEAAGRGEAEESPQPSAPVQSEQPPVQSKEPSQPSQTPAPVTGDVDGNGEFNLGDVQMALKLALRIELADKAINVENAKKLADVDGNGTVTLEDAQKLLKAALLIAPLE